MYGNPHLPPAGLQSPADVHEACGVLERFLGEVEEEQEQLQVRVHMMGGRCFTVRHDVCIGLRELDSCCTKIATAHASKL